MKVKEGSKLLLCTHAYPPDSGGIAAFARDIHCMFIEMNWSVRVYKYKYKPIKNKWGLLRNYYKSILNFYKTVNDESFDVIISTKIQPYGLISILLNPFINAKVIIQVHGTEIEGRYKKGWRRKLYQFTYNNADQVWANSNNTICRLEKFGVKPEKIKLLYPFLTNDILSINREHYKNSASSIFTIFTAGALYPRKGIDLVLKALSNLKEYEWQYIIAGQTLVGYEDYYEELAKNLGIEERVKFLGQVERKLVWANMKEADIFILTSRALPNDIESFGIVFMEALYFGTPCIGTNTGGIPEAIGEGGILIENENIDQLNRGLKKMINDKDYRLEISRKGRTRILNDFMMHSRIQDVIRYLDLSQKVK
ncbi:glycosyltransferase family 4 protein [Psychroflexus sp. CAK1W]|uniref:glycosyltransferase family 4 protein n=1 Tax=Psychroflexus curvus TaxID=2873595 RepID=UPI001CC90A2F|nr:glycosyltransferase family 4 protein [Psychroflexus curvus]MBZ9629078.1 glycosyltransferase family 4 protein [Psychroflexus curvus]